MSEDSSNERGKPRKDFAIHINQVEILGRVCKEPKKKGSGDNERVAVPIILPTYKKGGGKQWIPFTIDVVGEHRSKAIEAKVGDYMHCVCKIADRSIKDDNGDSKTFKTLQIDTYRDVTFMSPDKPPADPMDPPHDVCFSRVLIAGRHFIRKKQLEEGNDTPILREGNNSKYAYVNLRYEDPYQEVPEGEWPKSVFLDFAVNGKDAERANKACRNKAQLFVIGELAKKELDFTVQGKNPKEPRINLVPGGFFFMNLDRQGGGEGKKPEAAKEYSEDDTDGIDGVDDDLQF